MAATTTPRPITGQSTLVRRAETASASRSRPPSPMPGTASRNENRAAPSRVRPSVRAIVIVTPEREVPGMSASACAQPISSASRQPTEYSSRSRRPKRSASHIRSPNSARVVGDRQGIAQLPLDHVTERQADEPDRNGAENDAPGEPRVLRQAAAGEGAEPRANHREKLAPEIGDDGEQRADVNGDVEGEALVRPAEEMRHQHEVAGARNRQELGQALHDGENDRLNRIQMPPLGFRRGRSPSATEGNVPFNVRHVTGLRTGP